MRQRVGLARALAAEPRFLLMDEPLGALDRMLRDRMQIEIKHIQKELGITTLYVTHDQGEALTMSDRICVFNDGAIAQTGTPEEIYERPADAFVAGFVGESNFLPGRALARRSEGRGFVYDVALMGGVPIQVRSDRELPAPAAVTAMIRPEHISILPGQGAAVPPHVTIAGTVRETIYRGETSTVRVELGAGHSVVVRAAARPGNAADGQPVTLGWPAESMILLAA
jgi:ABC-type Fe3+/spermidine/putrescine transport system ATPase subunit